LKIKEKKNLFLVLSFIPGHSLFLPAQNEGSKEPINSLSFVNLFSSEMQEGVSCYRIPAIITATNGDIIVAIDKRVPSGGDFK
jgi:sialidase-1